MITDYITHEEAVIQHFVEDPDFADFYLQAVKADGDADEIAEVQSWYNEAQARKHASAPNISYWTEVAKNAKLAVRDGKNLAEILSALNDAVLIVKGAMTV